MTASAFKPKPCKYCGYNFHTSFACPNRPRKTLQTRTKLEAKTVLRKRGKQAEKWQRTRTNKPRRI